MSNHQVVEVSFVFRGKDAPKNAEAFMLHLDTIDGIGQMIEGIRHFDGRITYIKHDFDQNLIVLDGEILDEDSST